MCLQVCLPVNCELLRHRQCLSPLGTLASQPGGHTQYRLMKQIYPFFNQFLRTMLTLSLIKEEVNYYSKDTFNDKTFIKNQAL